MARWNPTLDPTKYTARSPSEPTHRLFVLRYSRHAWSDCVIGRRPPASRAGPAGGPQSLKSSGAHASWRAHPTGSNRKGGAQRNFLSHRSHVMPRPPSVEDPRGLLPPLDLLLRPLPRQEPFPPPVNRSKLLRHRPRQAAPNPLPHPLAGQEPL